jgi:hypothetical protein
MKKRCIDIDMEDTENHERRVKAILDDCAEAYLREQRRREEEIEEGAVYVGDPWGEDRIA